MELYGRDGTLHLPDPNFHGGEVRLTAKSEFVNSLTDWNHPFGRGNDNDGRANYRGAGLAELAASIRANRPHRCSLKFAIHVVDVLTAILSAAEQGRFLEIASTCERPAALGVDDAQELLA